MPELPDLQVFSTNLSRKLTGKVVEKIHAINRKKLKTTEGDFQKALKGATLTSVYREGKELRLAFDTRTVDRGTAVVGLHLMLKGQLYLFDKKNDQKFTIIEIYFTDRTGLALTDFQGQARATLNPEPATAPDALSRKVNFRFLKDQLGRSRATIKKLVMDQNFIRGIGNAYADEILWHARISPFSICNKIPDEVIRKLASSIKFVLRDAEKQILKAAPGLINGELRDFLKIHNTERTHSPTGAKILIDAGGARKTYYTDEQVKYT